MGKIEAAQAILLKSKGLTYQEIGEILGVSRQRAQQLVRPNPYLYRLVKTRANGRCEKCAIKLEHGHLHHLTYGEPEHMNAPENIKYLCTVCHRCMDTKAAYEVWRVEGKKPEYRSSLSQCLRWIHFDNSGHSFKVFPASSIDAEIGKLQVRQAERNRQRKKKVAKISVDKRPENIVV